MKESIYNQVEKLAAPIIKAYHDDLFKHDRRSIESNPGVPFLHFTGDTGTHIVLMEGAETYPPRTETAHYFFGNADRYHILDGKKSMVETMKRVNRGDLVLYYSGNGTVRKITQEKAEQIVSDYQRSIRSAW